MNKAKLAEILSDQETNFSSRSSLIPRTIDFAPHLESSLISVITGVRRCGKSSLLKQIASAASKNYNILYLDLEDPRLINFTHEDFELCLEIWQEKTVEGRKTLLFLDEIQNVTGWERWARYFYEKRGFKVVITGSNSELLSAELGSSLGGRYLSMELFPFSFAELAATSETSKNISENRLQDERLLKSIMTRGAFPIAYLEKNTSVYPQLFNDIVQRDVATRKKVKKVRALHELAMLLAANNTRIFNLSKTAELIGINDDITIRKFTDYLEEAYLFFRLRKFSRSKRAQLRGYSKFYCVDPILAKTTSVSTTSTGAILENLVFLELRRLWRSVAYWHSASAFEVDFIVTPPNNRLVAIQVCEDINHLQTLHRECRALLAAKNELKAEALLLILARPVDDYHANKIPAEITVQSFQEFALRGLPRS